MVKNNRKRLPAVCTKLFGFGLLMFIFAIVPASAQLTNDDCLGCHSDKELEPQTERGKKLNLLVMENALQGSAHEELSCTDCHKGENDNVFDDVPHGTKPLKVDCGSCHEDIYSSFLKKDIHGLAFKEKNPLAPNCYDCHGGHNILPMSSPGGRMSRKNQADTCGKCHGEEKLNQEANITKRNLISRFKASVHYQAILQGKNGASCTDCHSHHNILSSSTQTSGVSRSGLANSCRKCHTLETRSYWTGAHGNALLYGNNDVPNCTTCHGDHDMASLRTRLGDAKQWASTQVCIWCHGNARMMARYGLNTMPVDSYMEDFHGLTQRGTMGASATCSDCHDPHHSLPTDHPSSRMHISNRGPACGKCHGKVSESFAMSFTHRSAMKGGGGEIEDVVRTIYILLIVVSVAGMLLYNFLIWLWAVREKIKGQRKQKHIKRMSRYERVSHIILTLSFFILVFTGFALKFPETFWAKWLFAMGINEAIRAFIHRFAAITMIADLFFFAIYMVGRRRGRVILKEVIPRGRDFSDFFISLKFYLGMSKDKHAPRFGVFSFVEKFEFWALVWGTGIMLISGLVLWFPKSIPGDWPHWVISVSRVLHFYEALLATLAILIWHGFHTLFHPDEYPMNTSWLTGYITDKEAKHHFEDEAIKTMKETGKED